MTALLIDAGNTRLKWGVLEEGAIRRTGHIAQERIRDQGIQVLTTRLPSRVDAVMASNVAGASFATRLAGVIGMHCHCDVRFARSERRGWGVTNGYRQPRRLGIDRWVAMIAAWQEFAAACVVVDIGTTMTIDALDDDGNHLGGQIIPGIDAMLASLPAATSDLPRVKVARQVTAADVSMFGRNTTAAIREGACNALAGAVDRAIHALQSSGYEPSLVLTGGGASRMLEAVDAEAWHCPNLVLQGLATMLDNPK